MSFLEFRPSFAFPNPSKVDSTCCITAIARLGPLQRREGVTHLNIVIPVNLNAVFAHLRGLLVIENTEHIGIIPGEEDEAGNYLIGASFSVIPQTHTALYTPEEFDFYGDLLWAVFIGNRRIRGHALPPISFHISAKPTGFDHEEETISFRTAQYISTASMASRAQPDTAPPTTQFLCHYKGYCREEYEIMYPYLLTGDSISLQGRLAGVLRHPNTSAITGFRLVVDEIAICQTLPPANASFHCLDNNEDA